jgi:hypothetical protein
MSDSLKNELPSSGGNLTYKYDMLDCRGDKNVQWAMDGDSDWFTLTDNKTSKTLNVSANAISGDEEKSLVITPMINGERCPQDITVSQKGCGMYIKSIMEYPHLRRYYDDEDTEYLRNRTVMIIELNNASIETRNLKIEVSGDIEDILDASEFNRYYRNLRLGAILKIKEHGQGIIEDKTYTGTVKVSYEVKNPTDTDYSSCSHVVNVDYRPVSCDDFKISGVTSGGTLSGVTLENGTVNRIPFTSVNDVTLKDSSFWVQKYPSAPIEYIDWSGTIDYDYTTNEILITPRFSGYNLPTDGYFTFAIRSGYDSETETKLYSCDIRLEPRFISMGCRSIKFDGVVGGELVFENNVSSFSASTNELIGFSLRYDGLKVSAETHNAFDSYKLTASSDFNKALFYGESYYQNCETIKYEDSTDIVHISILRSMMPPEWCNLTLKVTKKGKSCECEDITVETYDAKVTEWQHNILSSMEFSFLSNQSSGFTYYYTRCGEVEPYIEKSAYIDINEEIVKECDDFVSISSGDCAIQEYYDLDHYCDMGCNGTITTTSNNVLEVDGQLYTRRCWIGYRVKNHWGEECESLPGFTVDQKPIECGCDSMNYFADRTRWTFDENGYDGKFLVMSASTQGCGILSALTEADMLVNGKTYIEYSTDELGIPSGNCYVWSDGVLPNSDQSRTTYVHFFLKPKGSSEFISCSKAGIWIVQDKDIKTCSDYSDLSKIFRPTVNISASSTSVYTLQLNADFPYETYNVGGKNERYIYYYAESNVDWMHWFGRTNGMSSLFISEINRGEARTGIITHYIYKDCSDYEYFNGEIVGVKGGYLCSSTTTVVTQEAMEPCVCSGISYTTDCATDFDVDGKRHDDFGHEYDYGYISFGITEPEGCEYSYPYYYDIEYSSEEVDWLTLDQDGHVTVSPNHATESADTQSRSADVWWDLYLRDPEGVEEPIHCGGGSCTVTQEGETCNCDTIMKYADYSDTEFDEEGGSAYFSLGDPCGGKITSATSKDSWIDAYTSGDREVRISVDSLPSDTLERSGEVEITVFYKGSQCDVSFPTIHQKKKCDCSYSTMSVSINSEASGYPGEEINIGTISNIPGGETGSCLSYSVDGASVDAEFYDGNLTTTVPSDKSAGSSYPQDVTVTLKEGDKVCNTWSGTCTITVTNPPCMDFHGNIGGSVELCRGESAVVDTITLGDYCEEFSVESTSDYLSGSIDTSTGKVSVSLSSDGDATGGSVDFYYGKKKIGSVSVAVKAEGC